MSENDVFAQLLAEITPEKRSDLALERYAQLVKAIKVKRQQVRKLHLLFDRLVQMDQKLALRVGLWSFTLDPKESATHQRLIQVLELMGKRSKAEIIAVMLKRLKSKEAHEVKPKDIMHTIHEFPSEKPGKGAAGMMASGDEVSRKIPELSIFDDE